MGLLSCLKCSLRCAAICAIFATALLFLPGLPPTHNMQFNVYELSPTRKLDGPLKLNTKLNNAERLFEGMVQGPESLVYYDGVLYTGLHGGLVAKIKDNQIIPFVKFGKSCEGIHEEHICGRPLGLYLDSAKFLYVADAYYGLFKVNTSTGEVEKLIDPDTVIEGRKPKLFNSVVVASDGKVYWTDSDSNVDLKNLVFSALGDGTGRLIKYDPVTKTNTVLIDRIHFANGVALAADESYVLVAETFRYRVLRYYLKGPKKGSFDIFVDGLPGSPDNIKADKAGNFYVSLVLARDEQQTPSFILNIGKYPLVRKFLARSMALVKSAFSVANSMFPHILLKKAVHAVGHCETLTSLVPQSARTAVIKLNKNGDIVDSMYALDGRVSGVSEIEIVDDYAYLGSPFNHYLARVRLHKN